MSPRYTSLEASGLREEAVVAYSSLIALANEMLNEGKAGLDRRTWIAPGRIELFGKHVDYAGGRSLLCAIDRGIAIVAAPRSDRLLVVRDAVRREALSIPLDGSAAPMRQLPWAVYPETVARRLVRNFGDAVRGCDIAIASNLPPAAGVSSSSALIVGLMIAVASVSDLQSEQKWRELLPNRISLAGYAGALENGTGYGLLDGEAGVGTMGGAQDQTAILNCQANQLDRFSWRPVCHEGSIPFPESLRLVVGVSGVVAAKTGAARALYNRAARTVHRIVDGWNSTLSPSATKAESLREAFEQAWGYSAIGGTGGSGSESDDTFVRTIPEALLSSAKNAANEEFSADHLIRRLHQFHEETWRIVPAATLAVAEGDMVALGEAAEHSMRGATESLENQIAETLELVRSARSLGAVAASAFGAGFGGAVWALVEDDGTTRDFDEKWIGGYRSVAGLMSSRSQVFSTVPSPGAFEIG